MRDTKTRSGAIAAVSACVLWGLLPIYWNLLKGASAYEIFTHRVVWSCVFMAFVLLFSGHIQHSLQEAKELFRREHKRLGYIGCASIVISINWLCYIWSVNHGHVLEASIGYYINPLVNVVMGVIFFRERLLPAKKVSLVLALIGILYMIYTASGALWISFLLAITFASYGLFKKLAHVEPVLSVALETLFVTPLCLAYILYIEDIGMGHFGQSLSLSLLLIGAGAVTATPMALFTKGANLLPLNVLGFLLYVQPTLNFLVGLFIFHEPFDVSRLIGFSFIWLALIVFSLSEKAAKRDDG